MGTKGEGRRGVQSRCAVAISTSQYLRVERGCEQSKSYLVPHFAAQCFGLWLPASASTRQAVSRRALPGQGFASAPRATPRPLGSPGPFQLALTSSAWTLTPCLAAALRCPRKPLFESFQMGWHKELLKGDISEKEKLSLTNLVNSPFGPEGIAANCKPLIDFWRMEKSFRFSRKTPHPSPSFTPHTSPTFEPFGQTGIICTDIRNFRPGKSV